MLDGGPPSPEAIWGGFIIIAVEYIKRLTKIEVKVSHFRIKPPTLERETAKVSIDISNIN